MMPGSQLMITGGAPYGSVGGIPPTMGVPPMGVPPMGVQQMGMPPMGVMGGFGQPPSPYGSRGPF